MTEHDEQHDGMTRTYKNFQYSALVNFQVPQFIVNPIHRHNKS